MKRVLLVDRRDASLELDGNALTVRLPEQAPKSVPLALLERVVLASDTQLGSGLLAGLADADVGLVAFGGRGGQRVAHLLGSPHGDARVRVAQVQAMLDPDSRNQLARHFVRAKLRGQRQLLRTALLQRPDLRRHLLAGVDALAQALARLESLHPGDDALRGLEGAAAAAHFRAYTTLFAPRLGFERRQRRPPPDPVNACLSLGYTLAVHSAIQACWIAGLDPAVGFLHGLAHRRPALACDLVEAWRPRVDAFVWTLFREGSLRPEDFGRDGAQACLLGKSGRARFHAAWAVLRSELDAGLRRQARALAKAMRERADALPDWEFDAP